MPRPSLERLLSAAKERRVRDWAVDVAALGAAALLAKHLDDRMLKRLRSQNVVEHDLGE